MIKTIVAIALRLLIGTARLGESGSLDVNSNCALFCGSGALVRSPRCEHKNVHRRTHDSARTRAIPIYRC